MKLGDSPPNFVSARHGVPAARTELCDTLLFYDAGFGTVTPDSPAGQIVTQSKGLRGNFQASFVGTPATVSYSGLTGGSWGLYQFNVVVPNVAPSDRSRSLSRWMGPVARRPC